MQHLILDSQSYVEEHLTDASGQFFESRVLLPNAMAVFIAIEEGEESLPSIIPYILHAGGGGHVSRSKMYFLDPVRLGARVVGVFISSKQVQYL